MLNVNINNVVYSYHLVNDDSIVIDEVVTDNEEVIIPNGFDYMPIIEIGNNCFNGLENIKDVVIPESVTKIGVNAFLDCVNLRNVDFLGNELIVEDSCFKNCISLESFSIRNVSEAGNITIKRNAFSNCRKLKNVSLIGNYINIESYAFSDCNNLISLKLLGGSLRLTGYNVLSNLLKLKSLQISGLSDYKGFIVQDCPSLEEIIFSKSPIVDSNDYKYKYITSIMKNCRKVRKVGYYYVPYNEGCVEYLSRRGVNIQILK